MARVFICAVLLRDYLMIIRSLPADSDWQLLHCPKSIWVPLEIVCFAPATLVLVIVLC